MFPNNNGITFNEILKFQIIDRRLDDIEEKLKSKESKASKEETTTKQQLLILHYLGVLDNIKLDVKPKAKLLAPILNRNQESIRKVLTYINSLNLGQYGIKTAYNLNKILPYFEDLKMTDVVEKIKSDMEVIEQVQAKRGKKE